MHCLRKPIFHALWFATVAFLLQSCSVHSPDLSPSPPNLGITAVEQPAATGQWWTTFSDPALNGFIRTALEDHPGVEAINQRIRQAEARMHQARAPLLPFLTGNADAGADWDADGIQKDTSSASLLLDWELDVWGRLRSARAAQARRVDATVDDWQAYRLVLSASVANTWFSLLEAQGQLHLADKQADLAATLLELTKLRAGQGQGSAVAVLQQQEQLQSIQTRIPGIQAQLQSMELAMDALLGIVPDLQNSLDNPNLPVLAPIPEYGMPSSLLNERPDLRAIRARVIALDHEVGVAMADRFPRFLIGGSLSGSGEPKLGNFVQDAVAAVTAPIFDAGLRAEEVEVRKARLQEALQLYAEAFLHAVQDTETAIVREKALAEQVRLQGEQLKTAQELLTETRNRYVQGASDYLPVLDAVSKVHQLERDHLTARRDLLQARVALHRALGGPMPGLKVK